MVHHMHTQIYRANCDYHDNMLHNLDILHPLTIYLNMTHLKIPTDMHLIFIITSNFHVIVIYHYTDIMLCYMKKFSIVAAIL